MLVEKKEPVVTGAPRYIVVVQDGEDRWHDDPWGGYGSKAKRWFFTVKEKSHLPGELKRHMQAGRTMTAYEVSLKEVK